LLPSDSIHPPGENLRRISVLTVLVLEDLVCNQVIEVFVHLPPHRCFNEVVELGVQLAFSCDFMLVDLGIDPVVLGVFLNISFEIVSVALLFLSQ